MVAACGQYGEFPSLYSESILLTESPFTTSKYILLHLCATGKDGEVAMHFPLIHQDLIQTVRARDVQTRQGNKGHRLFFVSVSTAADINPQIGDKLKGDTKRNDTLRKDTLSYFFLLSLISTKTITLKSDSYLLLKWCNIFQAVKMIHLLRTLSRSW